MTSTAKRVSLIAGLALTAWFVIVLFAWAIPSQSDAVPVGVDQTLPQPQPVSVDVHCNSLFDSAARDASPLPALKPQPKKNAPLAYQREPCALVHRNARLVFALDLVFFVAVIVAGALVLRRASRASRVDDRSLAPTSA